LLRVSLGMPSDAGAGEARRDAARGAAERDEAEQQQQAGRDTPRGAMAGAGGVTSLSCEVK